MLQRALLQVVRRREPQRVLQLPRPAHGRAGENKTAIIFEADDGEVTKVSYKELLVKVSQFANALKAWA
jgi:acyl-coenzyme A synthetase/AMP-(fatty) acid ligase